MTSLQCVETFPQGNLGKNKTMRGMGPKVDNIYTIGVGPLQNVSCEILQNVDLYILLLAEYVLNRF